MGYLGYGYRWAEPEMTETIRFNVLGRQDLRVGRGTFLATLADNREVTRDRPHGHGPAPHAPGSPGLGHREPRLARC